MLNNKTVNYICLQCEEEEAIPFGVVRDFDRMVGGDPTVPPKFGCESCGGEMYPEYYKGVHGNEYRIEDVRPAILEAEHMENVTPSSKVEQKGRGGGVEKRSGCLCG